MAQQKKLSAVRPFVQRIILTASIALTWFPSARAVQVPEALLRERGFIVFVGLPAEGLLAAVHADREGPVQVLVARGERGEAEASMRISAADRGIDIGGRTTVVEYDGQHLPYCDNLVNLIVIRDARHHNFLASVSTMVSARGRLFSIVDEGSLVSPYLPANWVLSARDAFNGIILWKKPIPDWAPTLRDFRSGPAEIGRRMVVVSDDTVWYTASPAMLEGNYEDGRDLWTGEVVRKIESPPDINHGRCYRNKATSRYLLGGKNGLDFIDPTSQEPRYVPQGLRATCQLGVLPCNGLIYLPPHACTCEADRKMNGFLAVAKGTRRPYPNPPQYGGPRFRPGPAYGKVKRQLTIRADDEWPTFRHDAARTGCAATTLPDELQLLWERPIGRRPSAAVCAGGKVYVAARDEHVLWALDAATGEPAWYYRTTGRIDSPPTVDSGVVVFGCRDGWLRCLREADGELVWRHRGAAEQRQIVVRGQLESVWPLHGATLVRDGKVYCASGRASIFDGGITVFCLDLMMGKVLARTTIRDGGNAVGAKKKGPKSKGSLLDVLSLADGRVTMRHTCFTPELKPAAPVDHLQGATGLLDDNFFHRSYWAYAKQVSRNIAGNQNAAGYIMTIDGETAYAYARKPGYYIGHIKGFERHLFATSLKPKQMKVEPGPLQPRTHNGFTRVMRRYAPKGITMQWSEDIPVLVKGMTVACDKLVVAGPSFELHPSSYLVDPATNRIRLDSALDDASAADAAIEKAHRGLTGEEDARLIVLTKTTGREEANIPLASGPVFDGVMAASGRLYICREDGVVSCFGEK